MSESQFKFSHTVIIYPLLFVFAIWLVFWYQIRFDSSIRHYGIYPQKAEGLLGIFTSPFIHSSLDHIFNNSIPLFVLSMALFYFYKKIAWRVVVFGVLMSGVLTWLIGKSGNHIGASGVIYVLVSFIFFKGIFAKHYRLIALSLIIVFMYGSLLWYVFPVKDNMSWEGHLGGLITGLFFALVFKKQVAKPERYVWEELGYNEDDDEFMKHFDEDGNFIELIEKDTDKDDTEKKPTINIRYFYNNDND